VVCRCFRWSGYIFRRNRRRNGVAGDIVGALVSRLGFDISGTWLSLDLHWRGGVLVLCILVLALTLALALASRIINCLMSVPVHYLFAIYDADVLMSVHDHRILRTLVSVVLRLVVCTGRILSTLLLPGPLEHCVHIDMTSQRHAELVRQTLDGLPLPLGRRFGDGLFQDAEYFTQIVDSLLVCIGEGRKLEIVPELAQPVLVNLSL
jgi:hypothetical protein